MKIIKIIVNGVKIIVCECFRENIQASDIEKRWLPFNSSKVSLLTAVKEIEMKAIQINKPKE